MGSLNIVNVGYDSTNYYVLADTRPRLLVDVGMPGTLPRLQHQCKRIGLNLAAIPYLFCTHYHPDHAGIAQEVKQLGLRLIVCETQIAALPVLRTLTKSQPHYVELDRTDNLLLDLADSRAFLAKLGLHGVLLSTPGHSDDSVSLILDEGPAFTGDLPHPLIVPADPTDASYQSWQRIQAANAKSIYPGHGPIQNFGVMFPAKTHNE